MSGVEFSLIEPCAHWRRDIPDLDGVIGIALNAAHAAVGTPHAGEVSIALTADDTMAQLNGQFRGKHQPTNVLAFPAARGPMAEPGFLGDMALGFETVAREAEAAGWALPDRMSHMIIHGYLHLRGYDHIDDEDAAVMEALEVKALATLGLPDPYDIVPS